MSSTTATAAGTATRRISRTTPPGPPGEAVRRYGDVPVCLVGIGMGGRAALRAAGHEAVTSVVALAPWLPEEDGTAPAEPVKQLAGRHVLIVHGTNDARTDPELSFRLAARAKKANREVCRFEVHADGHGLSQYREEVLALSEDFVMGVLFGRAFSRPVQDALAAPRRWGCGCRWRRGSGRRYGTEAARYGSRLPAWTAGTS